MTTRLAFYGTIIHSVAIERIEILENTLLCVDEGCITVLEPHLLPSQIDNKLHSLFASSLPNVCYLEPGEFLIPGLIDTHNHAPQWTQRGLGRGLQILDWLNTITFRNESKFSDTGYARRIYTQVVRGFLNQGITTASYYGSLHTPATKILAEICYGMGQRALIGKCNMDRNAPGFYVEESAEVSLRHTRDVIEAVREIDPDERLVRPILTPRFAISCTDALLRGLGEMAKQDRNLSVQTHFNEARSEIEATLGLFPAFSNEADLYESFGLLNERTILAHCCHMTEYETRRLKELKCGIAHCPIANTTVGGGFMAAPIREFLTAGISKIGLGTDSGGGFSISILDAMRQAFMVSNAREMMTQGRDGSLSVEECFYMATLGGAAVCGLEDKVGNFTVGKEFDACLVATADGDRGPLGVITPFEEGDTARITFEKFLMSGDDRNVTYVWVQGQRVK